MEWQEEEDEEDHAWCVSKQTHRLKEETTPKKTIEKKEKRKEEKLKIFQI